MRVSTSPSLSSPSLRTLRVSCKVSNRFDRADRSSCRFCLDSGYATPNQPRNEQRGLQVCRPCQSQQCLRPSWPQLRRRPYVGSVEGEEGQGGLPHLQQVQVAGCREPGLLQAVLWDVRIKRANPLSLIATRSSCSASRLSRWSPPKTSHLKACRASESS